MLRTLLAFLLVPLDDWSDFATLSRDKDFAKRCQAIDKIDKYKDVKMVQALVPLLADEHPRVRYLAMMAIGRCTDGTGAEYVANVGLKAKDPRARRGSAEALGWIKDSKTTPALIEALTDSDATVRAEVCSALGWMREATATVKLVEVATKDKDAIVRAAALEALMKIEPAKALEVIGACSNDKEAVVRQGAAKAWGGYRKSECLFTKDLGARRDCPWFRMEQGHAYASLDKSGAIEALPKLLQDKDWRVRCAAIEACQVLREKPAIGWLIDILDKEKGRLRWDLLLALKDLTGKDLGLDAKAWKGWWDANKETFQIPGAGTNGEAAPSVGQTTATFFKIPILSSNIVFILDLSGSMKDPGKEQDGRSRGLSKLDIAKQGMIDTIRGLPQDSRFALFGLGSNEDHSWPLKKQKTWKGKLDLLQATPANKSDAEKWVRSLEARGWTNVYDAIEYAFENPDVDTIYFYTDGGASKGAFVFTDEILIMLERLNRHRKIMIHTVEVPGEKENTADNIRLLKELATHTKGNYKLFGSK
jgi:HEAT repeat protein